MQLTFIIFYLKAGSLRKCHKLKVPQCGLFKTLLAYSYSRLQDLLSLPRMRLLVLTNESVVLGKLPISIEKDL